MRISIGRHFMLFVLLLLPILLFMGCASQQGELQETESPAAALQETFPGHDLKTQFLEVGLDGNESFLEFAVTEDMLFAAVSRMPENNDIFSLQYLSDEKLWHRGEKQYFNSVSVKMTEGCQPFCIFSDGEKTLYMLASGDAQDICSYFLYTIDAESGCAQQNDITAAWNEAFGEEGIAVSTAVDKDGFVYIGSFGNECNILVVKEDGGKAAILQHKDFVLYDVACIGGQVYFVGNSQNADTLFRIDNEKWVTEELTVLPESRGTVMLRSGQNGTILYGYYDAIYQYDVEKGEGEDIYAWANAGMDGRDVKDFLMDSQGRICILPVPKKQSESITLLLLRNPTADKNEINDTTRAEGTRIQENASSGEEPVSVRETIIICGDKRNQELAKAVGGFNVTNNKYYVEIKEYDYDRLLTEIMSGTGPDLIPLTDVGVADSVRQGIVEDLNPYLEASETISRDMLNERVLELYTVDGRLSCIPPSFYISTLFGRESELGSDTGWTMEEFLDYVEEHRGLTVMEGSMKGDSRMIIIMMMWRARQQQWIDWEQGTASFDEGEFEELLRYAAAYEAKYDDEAGDTESRWRENKILLYSRPVTDMESYLWYREILAGDMVAIGYPTQDGSPCNMLGVYGEYGISTASEHKEGAWAFIEYLVTSQTAEDTYQYGIPTLNTAMEEMLEESMTEKKRNKSGYDIPAATEADVAQFRKLIDNAVVGDNGYDVADSILDEEIDICLSGGRSVEETVEIIQNRVQLYLDENIR